MKIDRLCARGRLGERRQTCGELYRSGPAIRQQRLCDRLGELPPGPGDSTLCSRCQVRRSLAAGTLERIQHRPQAYWGQPFEGVELQVSSREKFRGRNVLSVAGIVPFGLGTLWAACGLLEFL